MDNQTILNTLSEIESELYYRHDGSNDPQGVPQDVIEDVHAHVRAALELWHKATDLTLLE